MDYDEKDVKMRPKKTYPDLPYYVPKSVLHASSPHGTSFAVPTLKEISLGTSENLFQTDTHYVM